VGSDQKLVLAKLRLRIAASTAKQKVKRYDIDKLRNDSARDEFDKSIESTILCQEGCNVEETWNAIKEGINTSAEQVLGLVNWKKKPE